MKYSNIFFNSNAFEKDNSKLDLVELTRKACFFHQDSAGIYSTLSLGYILEQKVEKVIQEELSEIGFSQVRLSLIQDAELWEKTGRFDSYGEELFKLKNRKGRQFVLGATCEESITNIVKSHYNCTKMDLKLFQIGNKYRDEMRAKGGLIRGKEFLMSDAYSFSSSDEDLERIYADVRSAYVKIFNRLGIKFNIVATDSGEMGGQFSEEFQCLSSFGEDVGADGQNYLEIGHIFNLGTKYSEAFDLLDNNRNHVKMGCFGIGVSRVIMALLEQHKDEKGFFGNNDFNTFDYIISVIDYNKNKEIADKVYSLLKSKGYSVLLDDRNIQAGKKFHDSEMIGVNKRIVINSKSSENNSFEILTRETGEVIYIKFEEF